MKTVVRLGIALLAAFVGIAVATCAAPTPAYGQAAPAVNHLKVAREAALFLDSLATEARDKNLENAGCVTAYNVRDSVLTIERIGPAHYEHADSTGIYSHEPLCASGVPTLHSHPHVEVDTDEPSGVDFNTSRRVGMWALLLTVMDNGWLVRVF